MDGCNCLYKNCCLNTSLFEIREPKPGGYNRTFSPALHFKIWPPEYKTPEYTTQKSSYIPRGYKQTFLRRFGKLDFSYTASLAYSYASAAALGTATAL